MPITLDLDINDEMVDIILSKRVSQKEKKADHFTTSDKIKKPQAYKRFSEEADKTLFREKLIQTLGFSFNEQFGNTEGGVLLKELLKMFNIIEIEGAIIFGDLISRDCFQKLVEKYDALLTEYGSKSWIHSYLNLGNHQSFLADQTFDKAFLHPLLITLIAYYVGGPVRVVDARAKDANPLSIQAQDNMLHIDNTPFNDEFKIIVTWEKSKPSGPKGQSFVFIPGTHKGVRQCSINKNGEAYSTENDSIFIKPETIQRVFDVQKQVLGVHNPIVVEAKHDKKPLTTVFAAGSLVHHRYRTEEGSARSCIILAFHRAADNPGQFVSSKNLDKQFQPGTLNHFLFNYQGDDSEDVFFNALRSCASEIAIKIRDIYSKESSSEIIENIARTLTKNELVVWKRHVTEAPTVEEKKVKELNFPLGKTISNDDFMMFLGSGMMMFDKHGPLNLILYEEAHEEIRKWARNRIREINCAQLQARLIKWSHAIQQPSTNQLLTAIQLSILCNSLAHYIDNLSNTEKASGNLSSSEVISTIDAYRSLRQLLKDLGESIARCENRQTFLSTSLFIFWAVDELILLRGSNNMYLINAGRYLLNNYIASAILIEKKIRKELCPMIDANVLLFSSRMHFQINKKYLIENHNQSPLLQEAYDNQFGLVRFRR